MYIDCKICNLYIYPVYRCHTFKILGKMNRKRNSIPTVYKHKKRICMGPNSVLEANDFPDDKELAGTGILFKLSDLVL